VQSDLGMVGGDFILPRTLPVQLKMLKNIVRQFPSGEPLKPKPPSLKQKVAKWFNRVALSFVAPAMQGFESGRRARLKIEKKTIDYKTAKKYNLPDELTVGRHK